MLLKQLVDYRADDDEPRGSRPYSRIRNAVWELALHADGTPNGGLVPLADPSDKTRRLGRPTEVPNTTRTVGIAPTLGADDIQYVLGWADDKTKPDRVAKAHAAFADLCRRWAHQHPDDPAATALTRFYDHRHVDAVTRPSDLKWTSKDLVVVNIGGRLAVESDSMWHLWKTIVEERKSGTTNGQARRGLCLVCGTVNNLLDRMPQALPRPLIPGADQEIALISANKPIHGYDYQEGLATAPVCVDCGQAAVANLADILTNPDQTFTYPRQRTRMAWWITNHTSSQTIDMLAANPTVISDHLGKIATGKPARTAESGSATFCSVTVSGNVSRLMVHDWVEMPLPEAEISVTAWLNDMKITTDKPRGYGIWALVLCAGQWQPSRDNPAGGRYIPLFDKAADRPDDLAQLFLHAALHGGPLPPSVLAHLVRRVRTDGHVDTLRAVLLRLALSRLSTRKAEGPTPMLDETQRHPAYLHGRLFSVLQSLQYRAYPKDDQPNTSFFHRYFAGAVANPRIAFIQGMQMYPAWHKKLLTNANRAAASGQTGQAAKDRAAATRFERRIGELQDLVAQPVRPLTTSEDQAWFILGYFHQRAHDFRQAAAGAAPEIVTDTSPIDADPLEGTPSEA